MFRSLPLLLCACTRDPASGTASDADTDPSETTDRAPRTVRLATWNVSMFRRDAGDLAEDLADPAHPQAVAAAAVLQEIRPQVLLLNEFDYDPEGVAAARFRDGFLAVSQGGREPLDFPFLYVPEVNTGVPSGEDLDGSGTVVTEPGSEAYGNDAFGFGEYPGQYGLLILSSEPLDVDAIRTFRTFRWADVPDTRLPTDYYAPAAAEVLRLSSKIHADVPVDLGGTRVHFLVSHPTPPSFDGPEDHNGLRNADEIRFWLDYLDGGPDSWHVDDDGVRGALVDEPFVIAGDLNNDPHDGDGDGTVTQALLAHPRVQATPAPRSEGGVEQAALQGGANDTHTGDPAEDTADFSDGSVGNLRIDYLVPSAGLDVTAAGVFWPETSDPSFGLIGEFPFPVSDHRPVWIDVRIP